ncbi:anti-sigma factor family protein [Paenibacillus sp. GCM10023250]|uniref:anti-sigma factor family protein n=1 Tax=Paenibacillus sp. GCM10023250 TaxID=3252648 RepID=UPI00361A3FE0
MNCQEVMDYMQRQLDGDLDERETEILMNHTRHCSECAAMFERLKRLSEGLESLPKVAPSYSLVDAILPKLAELSAAEEARTVEPPPIVAAGEGTNPRRTQKSGNGWRRWLPMSTAGGVVAAGVIVGMFFLNSGGTHTLRDSADSGMAASADNAADSSASIMNEAIQENNAAADTGSSGDAAAKNDGGVAAQGAEKNKAAAGGAEVHKDQIAVDPNGEAMPPIMDGRSAGGADADQSYPPNFATGSSGEGDTAANGGGNAPAAGSNQTLSGPSGAQDGVAADRTDSSGGNMSAMTPDNNPSVSSKEPVMASPISADKQYQAFIVDGDTVSVYTVDGSELKYQSAKRTGIADLRWTEDDKLTYTAVDADGVKKTFVVNPKTGTEQKQSSK